MSKSNLFASLLGLQLGGKDKFDYSDPTTAPHLVYRGTHGGISDYALTRTETVIGRSKKNHIVINDVEEDDMSPGTNAQGETPRVKKASTVSKIHAAILRVKNETFLIDKGQKDKPTNGVKINGNMLAVGEKRQLKNGDKIRFGPIFLMTFYEAADKVRILEGRIEPIKFDSVNLLPALTCSSSVGTSSAGDLHTFSPASHAFDEVELRSDYEKLLCMYELLKEAPWDTSLSQHLDKSFDMALSLHSAFEIGALFIRDKKSDVMKLKHFRFKTKQNMPLETAELVNEEFFKSVINNHNDKTAFTSWGEKGCLLSAPLVSDSVIGVYCIYSRLPISPTNKELGLIGAISNHVCYTMENASLLAEEGKISTLKEQLSRFLSPTIVKCMSDQHRASLMEGAKKVKATMLFVDIRGFTSYSEKCSPEKLVEMLNEYFERLVQCVFKYNGLVDKFVGDCLMAVFGAVEAVPQPELRAIRAAQEISKSIVGLNQFLQQKGSAPITVGIGLHTGDVLAGFFGCKKRLEYSVHGDNVCIASKACDAAKDNGICATLATLFDAFPNTIYPEDSHADITSYFPKVDQKIFKGQKKPVAFYSVDVDQQDKETGDARNTTRLLSQSPTKKLETIVYVGDTNDNDEAKNYPYLAYQCSYGVYELYYLKEKICNVGRDLKNEVVIKGSVHGVSRNHAVITRIVKDGKITEINIKDKSSTSGTFINGVQIAPEKSHVLKNGDKIGFANAPSMEYFSSRAYIPEIYLANSFEDVEATVDFNHAGEESIAIHHELKQDEDTKFRAMADILDYDELRQDYAKLLVVYQLSKLAASKATLQSQLKKALEFIFKILSLVEFGAIILLDEHTGPCSKIVQFCDSYDGRRDINLSPSVFKKVYDTKLKLILTDTAHDLLMNNESKYTQDNAKTIICVPVLSRQKVLGIVYLSSSQPCSAVSKKDLSLLDAICNHIAIAVENSKIKAACLETNKIRDNFSRYLSPALVEKIGENQQALGKKGMKMKATVMYVNIIDFSSFRAKNADEDVENTLNAYFGIVVDLVFKYDGIVDKYIGNQVMAIFGTLDQHISNPELRAVQAALEIKDAIIKLNNERAIFKMDPISIKIGLNTGSTLRMEYTVIGDTVNIAARTASSAEANQVLITESTFAYVSDNIQSKGTGEKVFKGKSMPILCHEVVAMNCDFEMANPNMKLSPLPHLPQKIDL